MKKIGKYEIVAELGRGAMGVVYKALDPLIGREVAIKVISESALDVPEIKERFYREAQSVGQLSHENITILHDVGEDQGNPYLVMEYLAGADLRFLIHRKTPLYPAQQLDYARQICRGLQYAHSKGLIHRDIKPENIKVLEDGKVKIMDFGIARPLSGYLTQTGAQIGTPAYMSPEQIRGEQLDQRSDIFSFGIVFYELLMYRQPFEGETATVMYKILHQPPSRLALEEAALEADLQEVISKCLEKEAKNRYPDFAAVLKAIDRISEKTQRQEQALGQEQYLKTVKVMRGDMVGETVSHYRILAHLGAGGMGIVYKAEDTKLRRSVALKFLPPEMTRDEEAKRRFVREAQAASALDHPNICAIHEIDETETGQSFICMAFYDGETLRKKVNSDQLSVNSAVDIAIQIAQGLAKAHEHGIIHRDLKPANLVITKEGVVKILDFGVAKLGDGTRLTKSGVVMGTPAYMSPEQIQNLDCDHPTQQDIWALGVVLYEMLTGKLPFPGEHESVLLYAILCQPHVPVMEINPDIPPELAQIIDKALQKQAAARYSSMPEMLQALQQAQQLALERQLHDRKRETNGKTVAVPMPFKGVIGSKEKSHPRKAWMKVAAVAAILVFPSFTGWHLLSCSDLGDHATTAPSSLEPAAEAALAPLKEEAQQVSAEIWATTTYENALLAEAHGVREFAAGNFAAANAAYAAAADSFGLAIATARRDKEAAMKNRNQLQMRVDNEKREMQRARLAAEKATAGFAGRIPQRGTDLFARALQREQEGDRSASAGSTDDLAAALQAYSEARNGYVQAQAQIELVAQVESARLDMEKAKEKLPGGQEDWKANANYLSAAEAAANGNRQFQAADYGAARNSFERAKAFYREAARELNAKALQSLAEAAQNSMLQARAQAGQENSGASSYREAERLKTEGENAYNQKDFETAEARFTAARELYNTAVAEAKTKLAEKANLEAGTQREIQSLIDRLKMSLENRDLGGLKAVYENSFMAEEETRWPDFFKIAKDIKTTVAGSNLRVEGNSAQIDIAMKIAYANNKNKITSADFSERWALEQSNGRWLISSRGR